MARTTTATTTQEDMTRGRPLPLRLAQSNQLHEFHRKTLRVCDRQVGDGEGRRVAIRANPEKGVFYVFVLFYILLVQVVDST